MLNNEFEKQVESAMLLIAQEQIPDTPHRFPPDFEARLVQQFADTGIRQTHTKTAQPIRVHKSKTADHVSRLLTWGSLAAGVMAAVTVGAVMLHEQRNELTAPKNQDEPAIQELLPESEPVCTVSDTTTSAVCTTVSASMTSITTTASRASGARLQSVRSTTSSVTTTSPTRKQKRRPFLPAETAPTASACSSAVMIRSTLL